MHPDTYITLDNLIFIYIITTKISLYQRSCG